MKGIILAGGSGTRLHPLTISVSKQLLPVFDKPMIFYPLTTLILSGVKEVLIISKPEELKRFQNLLGDGSSFGIKIVYASQESPRGIAEAPIIAEKFLNGENMLLILGDNLLHGSGLGNQLRTLSDCKGSKIFAYQVQNPEDYGVIELDSNGYPLSIEEKPETPKSKFAIPGLYYFDNRAVEIAKTLQPSLRGELEITEIIKTFMQLNELTVEILPPGTAWLDMGSFENLLRAGEYVQIIQSRQGILIGDPIAAATLQNE